MDCVWSEPELAHGVCVDFIQPGNAVIFSGKKNLGGEKWRGYLCLTEVKSFSPRPAASPLTGRQPPPADQHSPGETVSTLHNSCHWTEPLAKFKQLNSELLCLLLFVPRREAELRRRAAHRQVNQVQGQLSFFFSFPSSLV